MPNRSDQQFPGRLRQLAWTSVMPVDPPQRSLLNGDPPFLREATRPVPAPPPGAVLIKRVNDLVDRWRIGVVSFVVPAIVVILAGFWMMAGEEPRPQESATSPTQDPSAVEAVVDGVTGMPDQSSGGVGTIRPSTTGATTSSDDPVGPPGLWGGPTGPGPVGVGGVGGVAADGGADQSDGEDEADQSDGEEGDGGDGDGGDGSGAGSPAGDTTTSAPAGEQSTTAAPIPEPPPASPTNPPAPAPTAPSTTTTAPATTVTEAPPPSLGLCVLTVRWRTTIRSEPSADAEEVGRAGGWHAAVGVTGSGDSLWYEIPMRRGSGWIPVDRVRSTWGECG